MLRSSLGVPLTVLLIPLVLIAACSPRRRSPVYYPTPPLTTPAPGYPGQAPGSVVPGTAPPPVASPGSPAPQVPASQPPVVTNAPPLAPVLADPITLVDLGFLRARAQAVFNELLNGLPATQQGRIRGIPLLFDAEVGEVNAFAACSRQGKAAMAISDGLLDIQAHLAQAQAIDELFGQQKVDAYVRLIAQHQRPKSPIIRPAPGFFDPAQAVDGRKVQRQHQLFDEQVAFVLGHELAHHYLGHLPCTASSLTAAEIGVILSDAVPLFNQPNELAADMAGVNNLLTAGTRRPSNGFTEAGALLTLRFFSGIDQFSVTDLLFGFERTHPPPAVRIPVVQQTAATWRATGGRGLPILSF